MKFRFTGTYSAAETISFGDVTWYGREPAEVSDAGWIARLSRHPEFDAVADDADPLDRDGDGAPGGSLPKRRGRKPKV